VLVQAMDALVQVNVEMAKQVREPTHGAAMHIDVCIRLESACASSGRPLCWQRANQKVC
jgi:hypothetical protein